MQEQSDGPAFPIEMTLKEFRDVGYLQEVNRRFLHPLGLALAIGVDTSDPAREPTGSVKVWDGRDDPEGFIFESWDPSDAERGDRIERDLQERLTIRQERLGFGVQPIELPQAVGRD